VIATTKRLLLASAVVGLAAIGTANAAVIDSVTEDGIWNAATPGADTNSASQQGLPSAAATLPLVAASSPFAAAINYNDSAANTIGGFFASDSPASLPPGSCNGACQGAVLSGAGFSRATLFEFTFVETVAETLTITHDDGVSVFVAGTEPGSCTIASCPGDLLPTSAASPTTAELSSVAIGPGTYDLWYAEVNDLPAVLEADSTPLAPSTPLPATLPLFASGLGALGLLGWRRKRKARGSLLGVA
jgi:hypothetical protein